MKKLLAIVFLLAFAIRLIALDQSLWLDEGTTARVVSQYGFTEIVSRFSPSDFHPPLYYLTLKLWTNIFGYSEVALRFPSILFSLLAGWMVFLIGKKLKNERTGLYASIFFLFNPLIVYYSQEARMYMMTTLLISAVIYFFLHKKYFLTNIFIFLSLLTFYGSIFFIGTLYLYLLVKKQYKTFYSLLPGFALPVLIISPLLLQQLSHAKQTLGLVPNWKSVLGTANLKNLLLIPLKFSFGRISFHPKSIYYLIAGLWTIFVFYFLIRGGFIKTQKYNSKLKSVSFLLFLFLITLVLGFFSSFFTPLLQYFRFLYLIPVMSVLIALGLTARWQRIILFAGFFTLSCVYLFNSSFHREDWKNLSRNFPKNQNVYMIASSSDPLLYYRKDLHVKDIRDIEKNPPSEKEITVLPYTMDIFGIDYTTRLKKLGYNRTIVNHFRGVDYEIWAK